MDLIDKLTSGSPPDYAAFSSNCTTICENVLHDLGLDFGNVTPDHYWANVYRNFSPAALDNPLKDFFVPYQVGHDYGNPRNYGVDFTQLLFQIYAAQWSWHPREKQKACVTAGGETTCEDF